MRDGVVTLDGVATSFLDSERDRRADGGGIAAFDEVQPGVAGLLGVDHAPELAAAGEFAGVAELAAHLGVAGGGVEHHGGLVLEADDFEHARGRLQCVVAEEARGRLGLDLGQLDDGLLLRGAGAGLLLLHQGVEAGHVHGQAALAGHQLGEVEGEALFVIKAEREGAGDLGSTPAPGVVSRALAGNPRALGLARHRSYFARIRVNREGAVDCARGGRGPGSRRGGGNLRCPKPFVGFGHRDNSVVPRIATDVMELLLKVRVATHQAVK